MKRAAAIVAAAALLAPVAAEAYPTRVPVSLTSIPGNTVNGKFRRASVSAGGVLTTAVMPRGGSWQQRTKRHLTASELKKLRSLLRVFNPADLKPNNSAGCNGPPIGDVGGNDLRVGSHESNCPPKSASRLIALLSRWLPS